MIPKRESAQDYKGKIDFGIITIRDDEYQAVLDRLPTEILVRGRQIYSVARLKTNDDREYLIGLIKCPEQGNLAAQAVAHNLIEDLDPQWLIVAGIAGSVPDNEYTLGDVLLATRLQDFNISASNENSPQEFDMRGGPMHPEVQSLVGAISAIEPYLEPWNTPAKLGIKRPEVVIDEKDFYGDEKWIKKVRRNIEKYFGPNSGRHQPSAFPASIASSDTLVKDTKLLQQWLKNARQIKGIEMELAGVYQAAWNSQKPILAVRGISDIVGFDRSPEWTSYACHTAASFLISLLRGYPPIEPCSNKSLTTDELNRSIDGKNKIQPLSIPGFTQITPDLIAELQTNVSEEINKLAIDYYRINDRSDLVLKVVCNDIDVRNEKVTDYALRRLDNLSSSGTFWILGNGGSGKTTILHRLAVELTRRSQNVFMLNLETLSIESHLETILSRLKYYSTSGQTVLCIDNPAANEEMLEALLRQIPDYCHEIHILLAEREHRYYTLKRTGCLTYLHGEEENEPVKVHNPSDQRQKVYHKLFDLLGISDFDRAPLMEIALNERLVYVNATYSILLELKRAGKIDFDFDWDDYRKSTINLPAFTETYKYIALFYLFGVKTPFTVLGKIFAADKTQQQIFLETFRGFLNEPVILEERRDDASRKSIYVRTKHEIISEIFFREYRELNKDELLMEWCENTDFGDVSETQALINIFGAKKNYSDENLHINFPKLIDFLLQGYLHEKIVPSSKLNATLHTAKFWLLIMQGKPAEAIKVLETFLESVPEDLHSRTELAKIYIKQGSFDKAETVLLPIKQIKANDLNSRLELAKVYQKQNRLDEAEAVLLELLEIEHRSIRANTELAKIYQRQNKLDKAKSLLLDVLEIKPKDLQSRTELAKIYQRQNKLDKAESLLLEILQIKPKDLQSRTELAKIFQRQNKLDKAESLLLESLQIDDKQLHPRTELAKIYQRQGKLDEAIQRLKEYIELDTNGLHPRTELAKIYQRQNKLDKAESVLLEILQLDKNNLQSRTELAKIYQRQNKLDKAESLLLESLQIDDKQLHPRTELAKIYQRQGKLDKAESLLLESLQIDNKQLHPRTELAKIYQRQGKLNEAESVLLESLHIDNRQLHPRTELAKIYQRQNKLDKAESVLLEILQLDKNNLQSRTELARIYQRQGKFEEATKRLEESLTFDPLDDHAMSELLAIWKQQGEKEKCAQRFLEFIAQSDYRFTRYSQAPVFRFFQCCRAFNLKESAEQVYERFKSELDDQNLSYYMNNFGKIK